MAQSIVTTLRDGQDYINTWPMKKELYAYFPECRVIAATKLAQKTMPPIAVVASAALVNVYGASYLPQALAVGAFFISLPLQGMFWLGHRSEQLLPPQLQSWYVEIHAKMREEGCRVQRLTSRPKYRELAGLLKTAFNELDRVFTRQWF